MDPSVKDLRLQTGYRDILKMALPISLAMIVPQINFITNNVFLSGLGEQELACAGITGVYYLMFAVVGSGLNNGLQALIARRAGQNLHGEIGKLFYNGVWLAIALSAVGILLTCFVAPAVLRSTIHNTRIAEQAIDFLYIRIWGLPLFYLYVMRNALLVGTNQTRLLVWGTLAEAVTNIFFDYGMIYGKFGLPEIGFNGAAYASIIAEATGLLVIYVIIHIKKFHHTFGIFQQRQIDPASVRLILVQSLPLIVQLTISILSWEYFYILIEHHGERALAISNSMRNVFGVAGIFSWAFAAACNTMVSNIIGQNRQEEVIPLINKIVVISVSFTILFCVFLNLEPTLVLSIYGQGPEFIAEAIPVLRVVSLGLVVMAVGVVWLHGVTGTGNTVVTLTIELAAIVLYSVYVYVVLEYLNKPITWGWASEWFYWLTLFLLSYFYFLFGKWREKVI